MKIQPFLPIIFFFSGFAFGFIVSLIQRWMDNELPTRREIKRRMNQPRPRAK